MQHLKAEKDKFVYRTAESGDVVEIEIDYDLGSTYGLFGGPGRPRGVMMTVRMVKIEGTARTYRLFDNNSGYVCMQELARKSPKKVLAAAEFMDQFVPAVAGKWNTDRQGAKQMLFECVKKYQDTLSTKAA